jgi:hypothetical protein
MVAKETVAREPCFRRDKARLTYATGGLRGFLLIWLGRVNPP